MRYPLVTNPGSTIYGLAFFEAANGWFDFKDYNPFRLRRSAGVGMRFFLPMFGLLGFDYGIGFDRLTPNGRIRDAAKFTSKDLITTSMEALISSSVRVRDGC